jgi:hypothetical protein
VTTRATGTFEVTGWTESPISALDGGPRLTRARVTSTWRGAVSATSSLEYLLIYTDPSHGSFIGFEHVRGSIDGLAGGFVLEHHGTFEADCVRAIWSVLPDSATGQLRGLSGSGGFVAQYGDRRTPYTLDYQLAGDRLREWNDRGVRRL